MRELFEKSPPRDFFVGTFWKKFLWRIFFMRELFEKSSLKLPQKLSWIFLWWHTYWYFSTCCHVPRNRAPTPSCGAFCWSLLMYRFLRETFWKKFLALFKNFQTIFIYRVFCSFSTAGCVGQIGPQLPTCPLFVFGKCDGQDYKNKTPRGWELGPNRGERGVT